MKLKNLSSLLIIFGLITCVLPVSRLHAQVQDPAQMAEALAREFIPAEILSILKDGLESRTPRTDVPIDIFKYLYLPAQQNMHGIFFFKCKNADLGFEGVGQAGEEEVSAFETTPTQLVAMNNIFAYIKQVGGGL